MMCTRGCNSESSDDFAASNRGTPRKPLRIRFLIKQRQSDYKTEEEVPTRENASEEATLEENSCSSFRGLPCWSVTGRRVRKNKQSTPSGREYEVENAAKILLHQRRPLWIESTSEESTNLDPRLDNEAESDTSTQSTNRMEVASSNEDVETSTSRAKGKSIMIPASEVDTGTWFLNSTHNAAELEVGHQNGSMASWSTKEDEKSSRELESRDIYEHTTALKSAVNICKLSNMKAKGKGITTLISGSEISTWSANPIQNVSEWATDDDNDNMACSSTKANKKRKRGSEIKNTSEGNGYVCNICNESFSTYQALGGHTTCHTKHKSVAAIGMGKKIHQCSVCSKEFATGQQLGGHMRAHYEGALSSAKRVKHNSHTGSSAATARDKAPCCSSSQSVNDIAPTPSQSVDTTKNSPAAAGSVMTEMVLPHDFDLNELPREGDTPASLSSSEDTPAADSKLDLTLSL